MPKCKLFESWTFRLPRPAPFDNPLYDGAKGYGCSVYNTTGMAQKATLHGPTMRALMAFARLRIATENGTPLTNLGAIGHQGGNYQIAEYHSGNKTDCVVFNPNTGKFTASQFQDGSDMPQPITLSTGNSTGTAFLFCLMTQLIADEEFSEHFECFKKEMEAGWPDVDLAVGHALVLCDNAYRRIENAKNAGTAAIKLSIPATGNVSRIAQMALDNGTYSPSGVIYGEFTRLLPNNSSNNQVSAIANSDFAGKYQMSERKLSQREEAMVPQMEDWYIIPRDVVRICEHAKVTTNTSQPMRNFLLRGPAGTGKTMSAQAIAAGLHLPYTMLTCNTNTEIGDLIGQFIPDTRDTGSREEELKELPKIADIIMHPPSVYQELTGEYDEEKNEDDVLQKLVELSVQKLLYQKEPHGQKIRYVESPLLEAIRHGYVCEIQERATRS